MTCVYDSRISPSLAPPKEYVERGLTRFVQFGIAPLTAAYNDCVLS